MPKLGDTQKMSEEENVWGMWDGAFWSKVFWMPSSKAWLIHEDILKRMRDHYES